MKQAKDIRFSFEVLIRDESALRHFVYPGLGRPAEDVTENMTRAQMVKNAVFTMGWLNSEAVVKLLPETNVLELENDPNRFQVDLVARSALPDLLWPLAVSKFKEVAAKDLEFALSTELQILTVLSTAAGADGVANTGLDFIDVVEPKEAMRNSRVSFCWSYQDNYWVHLPAFVDPDTGFVSILGKLPNALMVCVMHRVVKIGYEPFKVTRFTPWKPDSFCIPPDELVRFNEVLKQAVDAEVLTEFSEMANTAAPAERQS